MKALVAMSGGVDSTVTAYLLKLQGFQVTGITFQLWEQRDRQNRNVCCSFELTEQVKTICHQLSIEHICVDVRDEFFQYVIERFCQAYMFGSTPNPCILCNQYIKFETLLNIARQINADRIATGHYARIANQNGRYLLLKSVDTIKDQTYSLYVLTQKTLALLSFPVGNYQKNEIRKIAKEQGLVRDNQSESQDICFVGSGNYADFISELYPQIAQPGPVMDMKGNVIGQHKGIVYYTIGQRRGLGIAAKKPIYVLDINRQNNALIVGPKELAYQKNILVRDLNWIAGSQPDLPFEGTVKIRSTMSETPAIVFPDKYEQVRVEFKDLQWAPAAGQSAVFYINDVVIGGGKIAT